MSICNKDTNFDHKQLIIKAILKLSPKHIKNYLTTILSTVNKPDYVTLISLKNSAEIDNDKEVMSKIKLMADISKIKGRKF